MPESEEGHLNVSGARSFAGLGGVMGMTSTEEGFHGVGPISP